MLPCRCKLAHFLFLEKASVIRTAFPIMAHIFLGGHFCVLAGKESPPFLLMSLNKAFDSGKKM